MKKGGRTFSNFFLLYIKKIASKNISVQTFTATFMPLQKIVVLGEKQKNIEIIVTIVLHLSKKITTQNTELNLLVELFHTYKCFVMII